MVMTQSPDDGVEATPSSPLVSFDLADSSAVSAALTFSLDDSFSGHRRGAHDRRQSHDCLRALQKMESIIDRMQDGADALPVKTVKGFMSKIPSVFTGSDLVTWLAKSLDLDDLEETLHFAHLLAAYGYMFPIDDHVLTIKNDSTYYRFQTKCLWLSRTQEPDNTDYAVFLCKRTMQNKQRLELADYEAESLAKLQKMFSRKWEFIYLQAEAEVKVDKKRDKLERKILDSQERAFWDVHRPAPGCVNSTDVDVKRMCRMTQKSSRCDLISGCPAARASRSSEVEILKYQVDFLKRRLERRMSKVSKGVESIKSFHETYLEFDPLLTAPEPSNPWAADSADYWEQDPPAGSGSGGAAAAGAPGGGGGVPLRRYKRWGFSVHELLKDPAGREQFTKFLEKEFSAENIRFWLSCQELKAAPVKAVREKVLSIFQDFMSDGAHESVNVDSKVAEAVARNVAANPADRYCFALAEEHIFKLMQNDSYNRYIRSDMYKDYQSLLKKKPSSASSLKISGRKPSFVMRLQMHAP